MCRILRTRNCSALLRILHQRFCSLGSTSPRVTSSRNSGHSSKFFSPDLRSLQSGVHLASLYALLITSPEQIETTLEQLTGPLQNILVAAVIVIGLVECFVGYRIYKIFLMILGFAVGGVMAGGLTYAGTENLVFALLAGGLGGVAGAFLFVAFYFIGIFLLGAGFGAILGSALAASLSFDDTFTLILTIALAILFGILAIKFQRFMIILATAFSGAWSVVVGTAFFTTSYIDFSNPEQPIAATGNVFYLILGFWGILGIVGMIVQYLTTSQAQPIVKKARKK